MMSMSVRKKRISPDTLRFAAEMLKTLGHPIRLQIVELLEENEELPVHRIQDELHQPQPVTSQHLNKMRVLGLLDCRRVGGTVLYRIAHSQMRPLLECVRNCTPGSASEALGEES